MKRTSTGRRNVPIKAVVYGDSGVGKTTFAAGAPAAVVLDLEHGSSHLDVARVEVDLFDEALDVVRETKSGTLVVDSLTQLEQLITEKVLGPDRKPGDTLATFGRGYGQGNELALMHFREFLAACDRCPANVVLVAHAQQKAFSDPTGISYDRWQLAMNEKMSNTVQRWTDYMLFATFDLATRKADKKTVGILGERVLRTDANAAYLAKHRGSLPETLPLDWVAFQEAVEADRGNSAEKVAELAAMVASLDIDDATRQTIKDTIEAAAGDSTKLAAIERRIQARINATNETKEQNNG